MLGFAISQPNLHLLFQCTIVQPTTNNQQQTTNNKQPTTMTKLTAIGTTLTMVFLILITAIAPRETYAGPVTVAGDNYILEFNHIYFEVNAQIGGRITTFSLDGKNVLTGPSVNPDNYGSTFWTSPQSDWDWPPIPEIDNLPLIVDS